MPNLFKPAITATFKNVWLPSIGGGVDVVNGEYTTKGIPRDQSGAVTMTREMQVDTGGLISVLMDEIGPLKQDQTITVDGKRVYISDLRPDAAKAILVIEYIETRPVPPEMM
jgi:hypothetical protein